MEEEIAELRRLLAESQERTANEQRRSTQAEARAAEERTRREEEQRRREEEQRRREEEQRRREAAEADAEQSQPKNLVEFLKSCHGFSLALQVVTDETLTTQGDTTKPAGRLFPQRIVPWNDFPAQQETVWEKLSMSALFATQRVYPSTHQLDYVQKYLDPISSELGLRHYARDTVENPVRTLIQEIYQNVQLREQLQLGGTLMFESHTNLGNTSELLIEEEVEHMSISESHTAEASGRTTKGKVKKASKNKRDTARGGRGVTGSADQFCIYELANGQRVPVVLVEYKAPHKLPLAEIIAGLSGEIRPAEDVINKEGDDLKFLSKSLLAAVITQLFSSMIGKGVQRGYIFTAQANIFLYIPDDPTTVQYHLSIPSLDFQDDDENRFHRTSVAQISAFILNAFAAKAPGQSWHDATAGLETWAVEYIDILKKIPETIRKAPHHSAYKPGHWKGFSRSPIRTRARRGALTCNDKVDDQFPSSGDEGDDNDDDPPTPTPKRTGCAVKQGSSASTRQLRTRKGLKKSDANEQDDVEAISRPRIEDRLYCTHQCLFGLASAGALDENCPNLEDHRGQHLRLENFLCLIRVQLAEDRGRDADCTPLYVKGSRGALVKIRLSSHGYTFVAKAMKQVDRPHLLQEASVYSKLHSLQGSRIPVCLGMLDLDLPYYYDHGIYASMLILSWAGHSLHQYLNRENQVHMLDEVSKTLTACHKHRVLHRDVEPRNWLWDGQRIMLIDFERAEIRARHPLEILNPNRKRNRQRDTKGIIVNDEFVREIRSARGGLSRCIR
jgi:tRNA A-37 threonylcarbamoyl transferase component Bud32